MAWMIVVEWLARLVLLLLVGLSIWSISIIIERRKFFKDLEASDSEDNILPWIQNGEMINLTKWTESHSGLRAGTLRAAMARKSPEQIEKAVASYWAQERPRLEKGLPILGTLGSTTPFVGLLGTILGIIVAFGALSSGQLDSQKIMFALAEALILTAVGLAVAIPAVVAFNYFSRRLMNLQRECESMKDLLIAYLSEK